MKRENVHGRMPAICGIAAFSAAILMCIICAVLYAFDAIELFGDNNLFYFTVTRLILIGVFTAAAAMFLIGGIRYIKSKSCRAIIAIGGILYAATKLFEVVLYINEIIFPTAHGVIDVLFDDLGILYIIIGFYTAVFSLFRIKGYAIPIIGYTFMGIHCMILFFSMCDTLYMDLVNFGVNDNTLVNVLAEIFPFIMSTGVILFIPNALYSPAEKRYPVYSYPAYASPMMNTPVMMNNTPFYAPKTHPAMHPQYRPGYQPVVHMQTRPSVFNDVFLRNQTIVTDFLEARGYSVKSDEESLSVVKNDGSADTQNNVNTFVAKADGIYNFVEVFMGGYDLRKRLSCPSPQTARMILLSKYVMEVVKGEGDINALPEIGNVLAVLASYENGIAHHFSRTPNYRNTYILEDYFDLIDIKRKIYFMR